MKRRWNLPLWLGFVFAILGFLSYTFFVQFPVTRDFPWANFLLFIVSAILLGVGLRRAFRQPEIYRGKVFGSVFAVLSFLILALFSFVVFYELRQLPESKGAPRVGDAAPDFTLPDQDGKPIALADLLSSAAPNGKPGAALLIFYRGFW